MNEHPISSLMETAMHSIKEMIDVNTIVGDAVSTKDGGVIIPISKVSFGFAAGGGEYSGNITSGKEKADQQPNTYPFAGGSGAGVSITPVAFMVVNGEECRLIPANTSCSMDRIVEMIPGLLQKVENLISKKLTNKCCDNNEFENDDSLYESDENFSSKKSKKNSRTQATESQIKRPMKNYEGYLKNDTTVNNGDYLPPT